MNTKEEGGREGGKGRKERRKEGKKRAKERLASGWFMPAIPGGDGEGHDSGKTSSQQICQDW
jgi:hypothetical protein